MNNYSDIKPFFRVGVFPLIPDAYNCFYKMPNEYCEKPGFEMEILLIALKILNWNWTVIDVQNVYNISFSTNIFGKKIPNSNNFTGLLGLLKDDLIDIAIPSMRITEERLDACIFTHPISYIKQIYIIKKPNDHFSINFITETLDTFVWIILLVSIIFIAIMNFIFTLVSLKMLKSSKKIKNSLCQILSTSITETISVILRQPVSIHSTFSWNLFQLIFIISFLVFYNYFQSSMNSKVIAPELINIPFTNQEELIKLLESHKIHLTYYDDSIPICTLPKNCERLKKAINKNPIIVHKDQDGLKKEIYNGAVYFGTYDIDFFSYPISIWSEPDNFIAIMDPEEISTFSSFAFNKKKLKERNRFNEALSGMLRGIKTIATAGKYYSKKEPFSTKISSKNLNKKSLNLSQNLRQLFITYIIGVILSTFVLVIELIIKYTLVSK
ncbi:Extracellular solute-binding protein, family 3 domain-containing protein [Strongyloides ratti]|uniref:Extracellular solute-binding protein, family 3 domain-containing protein n=1 Tax=Strongyloides ratti TaxID=34506 RepID=A0A090MVS9_STRRB|nr:Extracellular solute-binding protein, family 3 domain-containing protein [Strongyloides ratti]CEF63093.1 Extracellular solute-binding protein, family 3 domain-containing protein [Strongyloides ratti]